jgi:hypothetical protein
MKISGTYLLVAGLQQGKGNVEGGCTLRGCEKKYCKSS